MAFLCAEEEECEFGPNWRLYLLHSEPGGIGYEEGYTTFAFFGAPYGLNTCYPFLDLRAHLFNDERWAANGGVGFRTEIAHRIAVGFNGYFDFRDTPGLGGQYQLGIGLELLTRHVDFRLNGASPIGTHTFCNCDGEFGATLPVVQAEIGFPIGGPFAEVDLYCGIGPYYLFKEQVGDLTLGDGWGGQARVSFYLFDGIELGGNVSYDSVFKTQGSGYLSLSFPLGPANIHRRGSRFQKKFPSPCDEKAAWVANLTRDVYRFEIIAEEIQSLKCCSH